MKLLGILLALLLSQAYAADRCVSAIGTATTGSCASTCNSADFATAATCYGDAATGASSITTALTQSTSDGDTITFNDGTHTITGQITTTAMTANGATITLRCRTATQASCILSDTSATGTMFLGNDAVETNNFTFQNIGFTRTVTMTDTARPAAIQAASVTGNITLDGVKFGPITVDWTGGGSVVRGLVQMGQSNADKTLTFQNNVLVDTVSVSGDSIAAIANTDSTNNMVVTGTVAAPGLTVTNLTMVNANNGALYCEDACTITGLVVTNVTGTESAGGNMAGFYYNEETTLTGTLSKARFTNVAYSGVSPGAGAGYVTGPYLIDDVVCDNVDSTASLTSSGLGGCLLIINATAQGTISNYEVKNGSANYGTGIYYSNGAGGTLNNFTFHDNAVGQGMIYKGGSGSVTITGGLVFNNTAFDLARSNDDSPCMLGQGTSPAPSGPMLITVSNVTFANNVVVPGDTACFRFPSTDTTQPLTITMNNLIMRDSLAQEIVTSAAASTTLNLTINNSNITDADDPVASSGSGTYNETLASNIETDPLWISARTPAKSGEFRLRPTSGSRCTGKELRLGNLATYDNHASFCPSIGGFGASSGDLATTRTARQ